MNALEFYIEQFGLDETAVMNRLQEAGLVSDNATFAREVDQVDARAAVQWLQSNPE